MEKQNKLSVNNSSSSDILSLIQVGLMASLVYVATRMIAIPVGSNAVLHLGDAVVFLSALLLGKKKGAIASAIGMTLFDVLSPYIIWAPFTLVIKGAMAYIAGSIAYRKGYEGKNFINNLFAFIVAGIFMIVGYFIAGGILNRFVYGAPNMIAAFALSLENVAFNGLQVLAGIVIALPLAPPLKKVLKL
ncbi:putative membrane protein [Clostridium punense]|uniref:Membrane protein n=1 Tax=Clostridium punense TaxID=1054297 RepID=A0ABS4K3C1_9CLOT|nr:MULTISPECIES: ECF transporter S component [Clostridium]EQB88680.1 hypothetical protein M918_03710 [Clostridium sp. BL8]MBP2022292.1 putative membrane protein [Clostridium punense]